MIILAKYPFSKNVQNVVHLEELNVALHMIRDQATTQGWGRLETISVMSEVLRQLRLADVQDGKQLGQKRPAVNGVSSQSDKELIQDFLDENEKR